MAQKSTLGRRFLLFASPLFLLSLILSFAPPPGMAQDVIKIGVLHSRTSPFAMLGVQQINAAIMAADEINAKGGIKGKKVELIIEDSSNSNTVAVSGLNRILRDKPAALMAPIWATQLFALFPIIEKEGIPSLSTSGTRKLTQVGNKWYFRYFPHDGYTKRAYTEFALDVLGAKKVGIIHVANEYGMSGRDLIIDTLSKRGLKPVAVESHNAPDKDMSAQLLNLKKAGADVVISQAHVADTALILKQQRQLGITMPHVASSAASMPGTLALLDGPDVDGIYVETSAVPGFDPNPKVKAWVAGFKSKFNLDPDVFAILYYDTINMLFKAIEEAGPDREAIGRWLSKNKYEGLVTTYVNDGENNMNHKVIIVKYNKEKVPTVVKNYDFSPK